MTLNSTNYGYLISKETRINHLLFMDDPIIIGTYSSNNIEGYWHGIWNGQMQ